MCWRRERGTSKPPEGLVMSPGGGAELLRPSRGTNEGVAPENTQACDTRCLTCVPWLQCVGDTGAPATRRARRTKTRTLLIALCTYTNPGDRVAPKNRRRIRMCGMSWGDLRRTPFIPESSRISCTCTKNKADFLVIEEEVRSLNPTVYGLNPLLVAQ